MGKSLKRLRRSSIRCRCRITRRVGAVPFRDSIHGLSFVHAESSSGGYFVETDRDFRTVPNPFVSDGSTDDPSNKTRSASTTIYYLITPKSSFGSFHRNKARTVHTLHQGRGRYVIIHADEAKSGQKARLETFVVGHNIAKGEKMQWIVEGGKYKASFLLPDKGHGANSNGLLISEVWRKMTLRRNISGSQHNADRGSWI